jgi:hypothetical protein
MMALLDWLSREGKLPLTARIVRTFAYGFLSIILAIYLKLIGFDEILIGPESKNPLSFIILLGTSSRFVHLTVLFTPKTTLVIEGT